MKKRTKIKFKAGMCLNRDVETIGSERGLHSNCTRCTSLFRDVSLSADAAQGNQAWIHIVELGEYPGKIISADGAEHDGVSVVTDDDLVAIMRSFQPGMLVDYEHFSLNCNMSSEAAGWAWEMRRTSNGTGLEVRVAWTTQAAEKIRSKSYRYISPVLHGPILMEDGVMKIFCRQLDSAGLTNVPNMKTLRPVSANKQTITTMTDRQKLCDLVGCAATATDAEIDAAIIRYKTDAAAMRNRATSLSTMETEYNELKAQRDAADIEKYATVADEETIRSFMSVNRAMATKHFDALLAATTAGTKNQPQPVYVKNRAMAPDKKFDADATDDKQASAQFRAVETRASERARREGIKFSTAFEEEKAKANL